VEAPQSSNKCTMRMKKREFHSALYQLFSRNRGVRIGLYTALYGKSHQATQRSGGQQNHLRIRDWPLVVLEQLYYSGPSDWSAESSIRTSLFRDPGLAPPYSRSCSTSNLLPDTAAFILRSCTYTTNCMLLPQTFPAWQETWYYIGNALGKCAGTTWRTWGFCLICDPRTWLGSNVTYQLLVNWRGCTRTTGLCVGYFRWEFSCKLSRFSSAARVSAKWWKNEGCLSTVQASSHLDVWEHRAIPNERG